MRNRDVIIACVTTLILVGLVAIHSNTAVSCGTNPLNNDLFCRQATWALLSFVAIAVFANIDYHSLARRSHFFLLLTLGALVGLLVFGTPRNGARRWFCIGPVNIQVAEFAKIAIILYIAHFASRKKEVLGEFWRGVLPALLVLGVTFGLIVLQPDFGTAVLIVTVGMTMLVAAGVRWKHVLLLTSVAVPVLFLLLRMREYRWRRLVVFLNPWSDPQGAGYHIVQSLIAPAALAAASDRALIVIDEESKPTLSRIHPHTSPPPSRSRRWPRPSAERTPPRASSGRRTRRAGR